jgi:hypothetical protein
MLEESYWYFTKPWESVSIRRGDALGFRAASDYFADLLAPGLSNGTSDARWISLLSWCLNWSHIAWKKAGGGDLSRRDEQRERYAWLRPLELLWVARTLKAGQRTGQLRGRRSIERWQKADRIPSNFAMSDDQFRRYRQVGTYGAYRVVLRTIPGLTTGDGWTPVDTGLKLARLVNDSLPSAARLNQQHFENGTQWGHWSKGKQVEYWRRHGWAAWDKSAGRGFLPTHDEPIPRQLPDEERNLLAPSLFPMDSIRRITADVLASVHSAKSHADLCDALAQSSEIAEKLQLENASLAALPAFSRFADAAMSAMRGLWDEINRDGEKQTPSVEKLARSPEIKVSLERLREVADTWLRSQGRSAFPHERTVTELAEAVRKAATCSEQMRVLSRHHHDNGGGRRWFREEGGKLVPLLADTGIAASDYRFRLRTLCLLAAQCGVAKMDAALNAMAQEAEDEEEKDYA